MFTKYLFVVCLIVQSRCDDTYTNKYDGVDLDEILASERLLNGYVNCLLEVGPCSPDARELKKNLPDAIQNDCKKCSDHQRKGADKVMHYIIDHRPDDWEKLEQKYDHLSKFLHRNSTHRYNSDGSYKRKYQTRLHAVKETDISKEEKDEAKSEEKRKR